MEQTRLTESREYTARREELRLAEIELMRQRERVAALRRALPPGAVVEDYVFPKGRGIWPAGIRRCPRCGCPGCSPRRAGPWSSIS